MRCGHRRSTRHRFHLLANGIELVSHVTPVIQIQLALVRRIAMHSCPGANDVLEPERLSVLNQLIELILQQSERVVRAYTLQSRLLQGISKIGRSFVEVPRRFHLLIASRRQLLKRAFKILRQQIAHGVKLQPNRYVELSRHQSFTTHAGRSG